MVSVQQAEVADDALQSAIARLVPQLSNSSPAPTVAELRSIIEDPDTTLFLARQGHDGHVVGMLTLAVFRSPTGLRAWIEDVVVDDEARGSGVASELVHAALTHAEVCGARTIDLTSRPTREAANRLYVRLGFEQRVTNVYRYTLRS
ncbi:MAG TPA: GNAT family N-acetyltransferase [Acidimicrobiales bacterium]|jgi:ribosomal protein S18 acetylase RimI-like enzyme|nr:GNAT family N-acetyltransferase [Acidimicrobiales bacterium]